MSEPIEALIKKVQEEPFAKKMGVKPLDVREGYAHVEMELGEEHLNIHGIAHGGAIFSVMDSAFELASNSHGVVAVALTMNVVFHKAPKVPGVLRAEAREVSISKRIGTYYIEARDSDGELVATCQAVVYRKA